MADGRLAKAFSQNMTNIEMVGRFFYIIDPKKHMFEKPSEVPDYLLEVSCIYSSYFLNFYLFFFCLADLKAKKVTTMYCTDWKLFVRNSRNQN